MRAAGAFPWLWLCVAAAALAPSVAAAQSAGGDAAAGNKARAQALLREGNAALGQGRAADALARFIEAYRLFPSPRLHYNIGQAHSLIAGHEAQAYEELARFSKEVADASPDLRAAAEAKRRQLRGQVALVSVSADGSGGGDAGELTVDGARAGRLPRDTPLVLGVGTHTLALAGGARAAAARAVTIAGGETLDIRLVASAPTPGPRLATPATPAPSLAPASPTAPVAWAAPDARAGADAGPGAAPPRRWTWRRKLGAGLLGAATAGLALGIAEHVARERRASQFIDAGCGTRDLAVGPGCQGLYDGVKSAERWLSVGYIGAAALGATGGYFLFVAPSEPRSAGAGGAGALAARGITFDLEARF
jgi:hypothetical protein